MLYADSSNSPNLSITPCGKDILYLKLFSECSLYILALELSSLLRPLLPTQSSLAALPRIDSLLYSQVPKHQECLFWCLVLELHFIYTYTLNNFIQLPSFGVPFFFKVLINGREFYNQYQFPEQRFRCVFLLFCFFGFFLLTHFLA